jgi:hypothetical protein
MMKVGVSDRNGRLGFNTDYEEIDIRVLPQNSVVKHQDMFSWRENRHKIFIGETWVNLSFSAQPANL